MRTQNWFWQVLLCWYCCWCPQSTNSLHFPRFRRDKNNDNNKQKDPQEHDHTTNRHKNRNMSVNKVLSTTGRCTCGKVKFAIQTLEPSPPPLRLVCYCSDCRGYYETLDRLALEKGMPPSAILDSWGGVDWTALYPRDVVILEGKELLKTTIIRPTSRVRQVYASCCHTPLFRFGEMSLLMNSNVMPAEDRSKIPIDFRIVGRDSWKQPPPKGTNAVEQPPKPSMSWSVPFRWFWVMPQHIRKDLMTPLPFDLPSVEDVKAGKVEVIQGFQSGSK